MKKILTLALLFMGVCLAPGQTKTLNSKLSSQKSPYAGYLFAYFEGGGDKQEELRFAVSEDAQNWYALNGNRPVIASDSISESGGIRDPHILRGEDGCYYLVATDMHTFDPKQGWGANPGIVMLKSSDLVNWTHSKVVLAKDYAKNFGDAYWVWAPQTIYDRKAKKYMIYFTLQRSDRKTLITYYAYANKDFTGFESEPKVLFSAKYGSIDNDIIYKDGMYHLFYKGNTKDENGKEIKNGIQKATSKNLLGPWKEDFKYLDAYAGTRTHVEGSSVFKTHSEWILMYDLYGSGRYEYQTSKDLKTWTKEPQSFRKDFFPRHGSVISVTKEELERVQQKWGWVLTHEFESNGNPIFRDKHTADPAVLVENDTLWLFAGHDAAGNQTNYVMKDWLLYSTTDMKHWKEYPSPLRIDDFKWAESKQAYAGQVAKGKDGRYYWYVSTNWCGIGVAVSDKITGPYKDALGKPLLTNKDCFASKHSWACIDPTILIDSLPPSPSDRGGAVKTQAYIVWGNRECYYAKLKDNMVEIDGEIHQIDVPNFTEGPWIHKYQGKYYLTYASEWPEKIAYAVADHIGGPYKFMSVISEIAGNSNTTHPSIVKYKGQWLFFSHNGGLPNGGSYSRSIIAEPLYYNSDGSIKNIPPTTNGIPLLSSPQQGEAEKEAYLMVYHKDQDHGLHMATSHDGYTWTALRDDKPIIDGDSIAMQHGIRDPHIFRGADGAFYLSMTDLHVFGQRDGKRTTEWERDGKLYGWGNNRGLVLMKSFDLIHWTRTNIDFSKLPDQEDMKWSEVGCVWAPETVFDEETGQLMIHFTIREGKGMNRIYYTYVNNDYNALTSQPKLLAEAPNQAYNIIDSDIIKVGDTYHLFYVSHEHGATPKHATAQKITGPYTFDELYKDGERRGHEAPNCWKRLGTDTYVVMFDNYNIRPMNFGFVETRDFFTYHPIGYFDEPNCPMKRTNFSEQKHGAVVQITKQELERLVSYWNQK